MRPTVLLFDIDGTLITTGGAARYALELALAEFLGRDSFEAEFSFGGMTDRAIFRRSLETAGVAPTEPEIDRVVERYLARLDDALDRATTYRVHDGIHDVLRAVDGAPGYAVGLGTGNVEAGARIKLERVGLNPYFSFGGFGCDHELRPALIRRGAERGAERLGAPLEECRVVVIGDTPKDVHAAHTNGFECVAVETGGATPEELATTGAEWRFPNLAAPGAAEAVLGRSA
jgi:phosphoglycolate phosphatase-like HAD superfamily hydrolase